MRPRIQPHRIRSSETLGPPPVALARHGYPGYQDRPAPDLQSPPPTVVVVEDGRENC